MRSNTNWNIILPLLFVLACTDSQPDPDQMGVADIGTQQGMDVQVRDTGVEMMTDAEAPLDIGHFDATFVDATSVDATSVDATSVDATSVDATSVDAMTVSDSGHQDATTSVDAAIMDAASIPDMGVGCGAIGNACASDTDCAGFKCKLPQGICMPQVVDTCGGFVGQLCPAARPECLYYTSSDYGPCFTAFEKNCVCSSSARIVVMGCP